MVREKVCKYCGKKLGSEKALKDHVKAKHKTQYIVFSVVPVLAVILIIVGASALFLPQYLESLREANANITTPTGDVLDRFLSPRDRLIKHIHPAVEIFVDGRAITVPAGIGIEGGRQKYMHTHDNSGVIHIETPVDYQFTLGDFFKVWGKRFDSNCVGEYCGEITVRVNGQVVESPRDYVLKDNDEIVIEVNTGK